MSVKVKFKSKRNMILVPVSVNGSAETNFVLDTGAAGVVLDTAYFTALYKRSEFDGKKTAKVLGGGGTAKAGMALAKKVAIRDSRGQGEAAVENLPVIVMEMSHLVKALGIPLGGVVGANFLRNFKVGIDYRRRIVEFEPYQAKIEKAQ